MAARVLKAGLAYFAIVFAAGFAFALVRIPLLAPVLGMRFAELLEMPLMLVVILLAAQFVNSRFALSESVAGRIGCGLVRLLLMVGGEAAVLLARGLPIASYVATRDPVSGGVYLVMLGVFALMPLLIDRLRPPPAPSAGPGAR